MPQRFYFEFDILNSVAGGHSAIDISKLNIKSLEEASSFISSYGFSAENPDDLEKLWYYHRRALVLMTDKLGFAEGEIPEILRDRKKIEDIRKLLLWASHATKETENLQKWSCAILRCMHVFVHAENDLFGSFAEEIQNQILSPFQKAIIHENNKTLLKGTKGPHHNIQLVAFEVKPFKTSSSTVIKLLAKPDALAMKVFDKLGVRFVTQSLFDSFQVIRFMVEENLISFPHIMPDQSSNNLYPVDLFTQVCEEIRKLETLPNDEEIHRIFDARLAQQGHQAKFFRKTNEQSGQNFRFIKFISRKLIRIQNKSDAKNETGFSFFYPFEVQIMDATAHSSVLSGPSEHVAYKERQKRTARKRLFPSSEINSETNTEGGEVL